MVLPLVPTKSAPQIEREQVYKELSPVAERLVFHPSWTYDRGSFLLLNNGLRIMDATDLLPAVDPASPTARFALAATEKRTRALVAFTVAMGMLAVGTGLTFASTADAKFATEPSTLTWGLLIAGGSVDLLALIPSIISMVSGFQADVETRSAFAMYPSDLRKRLALEEAP